jgi:hypothetical protein
MPLAVFERNTEPENQCVPLGGVVGPLVKPLDVLVGGAVAQLNSAGSRYRAGLCPPPSKWIVARFITSAASCPMPDAGQTTRGFALRPK